jgi:hypothetical protein
MENVRLQLKTSDVPVVLHLSQYDTDREYCFTPYYGNELYPYQTGANVYIEATKPDNTIVDATATYNEDGTVTYAPTETLTQVAGDVRAKFTWIDSDGLRLASAAVVFACDAAGIDTYARVSESDLEVLRTIETKINDLDVYVDKAEDAATKADEAIEKITNIDGTIKDATQEVENAKDEAVVAAKAEITTATASAVTDVQNATKESESWAIGGTGVRDGEDTNNAKYYAEQAKGAISGVASFNGRTGDVMPQKGDYTAEMLDIKVAVDADSALDATSTNPIQNKPVAEAIETVNSTISEMKTSFQDGCNTLVSKLTELGVTPASSSPTDIAAAIEQLYSDRYNAGVTAADARVNTSSASYTSGRTQGATDVTTSPNSYNLYTKDQYDANYTSGRTQGATDVTTSPNSYNLYTKDQYDASYNSGYSAGVSSLSGSVSCSSSLSCDREDVGSAEAHTSGTVTATATLSGGKLSISTGGTLNLQVYCWEGGEKKYSGSNSRGLGSSASKTL